MQTFVGLGVVLEQMTFDVIPDLAIFCPSNSLESSLFDGGYSVYVDRIDYSRR